MDESGFDYVIVGGGAAGWRPALHLQGAPPSRGRAAGVTAEPIWFPLAYSRTVQPAGAVPTKVGVGSVVTLSSLAFVATNVCTTDDPTIGLPTARFDPGPVVPVRVTELLLPDALPAASRART